MYASFIGKPNYLFSVLLAMRQKESYHWHTAQGGALSGARDQDFWHENAAQ
jgi:hypothetical protein